MKSSVNNPYGEQYDHIPMDGKWMNHEIFADVCDFNLGKLEEAKQRSGMSKSATEMNGTEILPKGINRIKTVETYDPIAAARIQKRLEQTMNIR